MESVSIKNINNYNNIIDIRDKYSYYISHINGAINIPYYSLLSNYSYYLDKDNIYYLYCDYGNQSKEISKRLNLFGYKTYSIEEGFIDIDSKYKNKV